MAPGNDMTIETVKATYDPETKSIHVVLNHRREVDKTVPIEQVLTYFDFSKDGEIVGIEVILP